MNASVLYIVLEFFHINKNTKTCVQILMHAAFFAGSEHYHENEGGKDHARRGDVHCTPGHLLEFAQSSWCVSTNLIVVRYPGQGLLCLSYAYRREMS